MGKRASLVVALLALLTVSSLSSRPILDELFDVQPQLEAMTVVGVDEGNGDCYVASDCPTMLVNIVGMDSPPVPVLALSSNLVDFVGPVLSSPSIQTHSSHPESPPPRISNV